MKNPASLVIQEQGFIYYSFTCMLVYYLVFQCKDWTITFVIESAS